MAVKFDPSLLDILVCPADKTRLSLAPQDLIDRLAELVDAKKLRTRQGIVVQSRITEGLIREDKQFLYPIVEGVPLVTREDAIDLGQAQ